MKLHLPIMMALFAVANYAQADDRLIFELGDTDKTLADGAVWTASSATLTVNDVAANNIGINYNLFSISFNATASQVGAKPFSYGLFFQITDLGKDGAFVGDSVKDGFGYSISNEDPGKYKVDLTSGLDEFSRITFSNGTEVDKSLIEGAHKFTLVFEESSVSGYVLENETYTELFQTTWEYIDKPVFEKLTSNFDGYEMVFGVNNTTVSNIAFYNGDITKPIPEPTTATLGLMALAGLVARRRRK